MTSRLNACGLTVTGALSLLLAACGSGADQANNDASVLPTAGSSAGQVAQQESNSADAVAPRPDKAALREKAKTDPDGADADAISSMGRGELFATAINTAGYLCARVTDMYPSSGRIIVNCVENRNGTGRAKYSVDASADTVEQL